MSEHTVCSKVSDVEYMQMKFAGRLDRCSEITVTDGDENAARLGASQYIDSHYSEILTFSIRRLTRCQHCNHYKLKDYPIWKPTSAAD